MVDLMTAETITISDGQFKKVISKRSVSLLQMANYLVQHKSFKEILTRPLLGELMSKSLQMEELLDTYGARNNKKWQPFRLLTATIKQFSNISYELLHVKHSLPAYKLLETKKDFLGDTDLALEFSGSVLQQTAIQMINLAADMELDFPTERVDKNIFEEDLPPGRLLRDLDTRKIETVSETVILLATAFLNLADESELVSTYGQTKIEEAGDHVSDTISEENLRQLELRFHNLQSLYDTYVSETEVEDMDENLPTLRGHISVVLHLLIIATMFAHYYERHVYKQTINTKACQSLLVNPAELIKMLIEYCLNYTSSYLSSAQKMCQQMLQKYAEMGEIDVEVPRYRGFHVRPSTLVAKIVLHYGSKVDIKLGGESYNAALPLDIFRINEKINANKRKTLACEIIGLDVIKKDEEKDIKSIVYDTILNLAKAGKIMIYEQPLNLPDELSSKSTETCSVLNLVTEEIARLQAIGKIDIQTDLTVKFVGDKRVLEDIKLLSESGYGEDNFGNNIALPPEINYLRK